MKGVIKFPAECGHSWRTCCIAQNKWICHIPQNIEKSLHETVIKRGHFVPNPIESLAHRNQRQMILMKQKCLTFLFACLSRFFFTSFNPFNPFVFLARWPPPRIFMDLFATSLAKEFNIASHWLVPWPHRHTLKWGAKTVSFLEVENSRFLFYAIFPLLKQINSVCSFFGFWRNLARIFFRY